MFSFFIFAKGTIFLHKTLAYIVSHALYTCANCSKFAYWTFSTKKHFSFSKKLPSPHFNSHLQVVRYNYALFVVKICVRAISNHSCVWMTVCGVEYGIKNVWHWSWRWMVKNPLVNTWKSPNILKILSNSSSSFSHTLLNLQILIKFGVICFSSLFHRHFFVDHCCIVGCFRSFFSKIDCFSIG